MASIERFVRVDITKGGRQLTRAGFGVGLILGEFTDWADRFRVYASYADLAADMTDADVLQAGQVYFGQSLKPTSLVVGRKGASETWLQALQLVQAANDSWYALIALTHTVSDVLALAGYIETQKKIFGTSSQDAGIIAATTTDIAYQLEALAYERTWVLYSATADAKFPEAAWMGRILPTGVGEATWKFKTLTGIVSDNLSGTALTNTDSKKCNTYIPMGGLDITSEGILASGEYIDVTRIIDWTQLTMEENIATLLVNEPKIPYTDKGIAAIQNIVDGVLALGVQNGSFSDNPAPSSSVPSVLDVPSADKASRTLNGVEFQATLAGAIHKVNVKGYVSI